MTVVDLLAHGHREGQAQPADEVLLLVAVEEEGVQEAHRALPGVEVQPDDERQPFPAPLIRLVNALDLHHRAHRAGLFHVDHPDQAGVAFPARASLRLTVGSVLPDADKPRPACDNAPVDGHGIEQI